MFPSFLPHRQPVIPFAHYQTTSPQWQFFWPALLTTVPQSNAKAWLMKKCRRDVDSNPVPFASSPSRSNWRVRPLDHPGGLLSFFLSFFNFECLLVPFSVFLSFLLTCFYFLPVCLSYCIVDFFFLSLLYPFFHSFILLSFFSFSLSFILSYFFPFHQTFFFLNIDFVFCSFLVFFVSLTNKNLNNNFEFKKLFWPIQRLAHFNSKKIFSIIYKQLQTHWWQKEWTIPNVIAPQVTF